MADKVRVPLLKAYLRKSETYPDHFPGWIGYAGWAVALITLAALWNVDLGGLSFIMASVFGFGLVHLLRQHYKGTTPHQQSEERGFDAVRRLRKTLDDGFERRLPPEVLTSLEAAVEAYNLIVGRVSAVDPLEAEEQAFVARRSLHACFIAAVTVMRDDNMSGKDWKAVLEKKSLIGDVVETIHEQTLRMREPRFFETERLRALRELNSDDPESLTVRG